MKKKQKQRELEEKNSPPKLKRLEPIKSSPKVSKIFYSFSNKNYFFY